MNRLDCYPDSSWLVDASIRSEVKEEGLVGKTWTVIVGGLGKPIT